MSVRTQATFGAGAAPRRNCVLSVVWARPLSLLLALGTREGIR
jgi:hypothetical protein